MIEAVWHADDLKRYDNEYYFQTLSFHDHVINLRVASWKHLLIIADPFLEQGPAMICLSSTDFELLKQYRLGVIRGSLKQDYLELKTGDQVIRLKWRDSKPVSFASKRYENINNVSLRSAVFSYKNIICKELPPSPAAVLFNLPGGDNYFRREIKRYFPLLVDALLLGREQEFLNVSRKLIGLGKGLTPTGDDLIHGALAACSSFANSDAFKESLHDKFSRLTAKTNTFGRHMLEMGILGLTPRAVNIFIDSIVKGRPSVDVLSGVAAIGSSSGYEIVMAILYSADKFICLR
jgi:hypothetical protein